MDTDVTQNGSVDPSETPELPEPSDVSIPDPTQNPVIMLAEIGAGMMREKAIKAAYQDLHEENVALRAEIAELRALVGV